MAQKLFKNKKIIIVGCGRLGAGLAGLFCDRGYQVFLIDNREQAFEKLSDDFSGFIMLGDGTDIDVLKQANIAQAAIVISVTGNDNINSVITQIAARIYHVDKVYARLQDPDKKKLISGFDICGIYPFELAINEFKKQMFFEEESPFSACFAIPGFTAIGLGYFMTFIIRGKKRGKLYKNQNLLIVLLIWIVAIAVFAFPFFLMGKLTDYGEDFNYIQGLFEATAGITTSGFSLFRNIEAAPKLIVMYRSILLLFGGTGLIMVMTLFLGKVYGMSLFNAEGHTDRIMPHVIRTAKIIIGLYLAIIAIGVFLFWLFGMTLFDAVCFAISAVSTGGFAPKVDSLASYNSVPIEIVTIVLMLLGGTNFMALVLILKGKFKSFFTHSEVKLRIANCVIFIPMFTYFMYVAFGGTVMGNFRRSAFQVISILTTTGLVTLDFPSFVAAVPMAMIPMLYLMFTGGGIDEDKIDRICDSFYSVDDGTTQNVGIGLSVSKYIVEQHAGTVSVTNNHNGGVTFTAVLPVE